MMFVGIMQLYDYIFWKNTPPSIVNKIVTKLAIITNHIHPFILALLIWIYKRKIGYYSKIGLLIYALITIPYTIYCILNVNYTGQSPIGYGLKWDWNYLHGMQYLYISYVLIVLLLIIENFNGYLRYIMVILFLASFIFSMWKYHIYKVGGRFWCNYSGFIPIVLLLCHLVYLGIGKYSKKRI